MYKSMLQSWAIDLDLLVQSHMDAKSKQFLFVLFEWL